MVEEGEGDGSTEVPSREGEAGRRGGNNKLFGTGYI